MLPIGASTIILPLVPSRVVWTGPSTFGRLAFSAGRLKMLAENEPIDVGPTRQVRLPAEKTEGVPDWVSIETSGDWERPKAPSALPR